MGIPRAVQEAGERADALMQQVATNTGRRPTLPDDQKEPQAQNVQPEPSPQPKAAEPEPTPQPNKAEPASTPAPQPPAEEPWEVKYKVLAGKYSAEVPRLSAQLRESTERMRELEQRVEELTAQLSTKKAEPEPTGKFTPDEVVQRYGDDFADAVSAVAARVADNRAAKLRDELAPQVKQAAETATRTARGEFIRALTSAVPDWKEIDAEDGFTAYLDEIDPMTGRTRREFFNEADRSNDALRISHFFRNYRGSNQPANVKQPDTMQSKLDAQLSPDSSRAAAPMPPGRKIWTRGEIKAFYAAARHGAYSAEDYRRIESDIFAAQRENRISA